MPDQKPLGHDSQPPKPWRGRSTTIAMMSGGLAFAGIIALAIIGFMRLADYIVRVRNGH